MGITSAKGFLASALHAGLKTDGNLDLGLLYSELESVTAAVFTKNRLPAAPVQLSRSHLKKTVKSRAILVNSKYANACTGERGLQDAQSLVTDCAKLLDLEVAQVLAASTGIVGALFPLEKIEQHLPNLVEKLDRQSARHFAQAILTTDTHVKEAVCHSAWEKKPFVIGGCTKGSGMIAPQMQGFAHATTLGFVTTDVALSADLAQHCLEKAVEKSFNSVVVDGESSTNDSVYLLANGAAGVTINEENLEHFQTLLDQICLDLAQQLVRDGEGAHKFICFHVQGAKDESSARDLGRVVASSPLVKTAFFGEDANWGRIAVALGNAGIDFDADKLNITLVGKNEEIPLCWQGTAVVFNEGAASEILKEQDLNLFIRVGDGCGCAQVYGCDLSYDYVRINGDYRS